MKTSSIQLACGRHFIIIIIIIIIILQFCIRYLKYNHWNYEAKICLFLCG